MARTGPPTKKPAAKTPAPAEREPDVEPESELELTQTGWVKFPWSDGTVYRLRRPFFGELKRLRLTLEEMSDEITAASERLSARADEITEQVKALFEDDAVTVADRTERVSAVRLESRIKSRELTALADELRVAWWADVFETLCVDRRKPKFYEDDGTPAADLPGWIVDNALQGEVSAHWRSAPLARG